MEGQPTSGRAVEVEVRIKEDGQVVVSVKGAPGARCLDVAQVFEVLGEVTATERTAEFYAGSSSVAVSTRRAP